MKRILSIVAILGGVLLVVVLCLLHAATTPARRSLTAGAVRILPAGRAYAKLLKTEGAPIPAFVNVRELVARGLLGQDNVRGFAGMEVSVCTSAVDDGSREVLIRVRQPDGAELVLLADGSVHARRR